MPQKLQHAALRRTDLCYLPITQIEPETGFNARRHFDTPDDDALYAYIVGGGKLPPVSGLWDAEREVFVLDDGERRWRQCHRALAEHGDAGPWMQLGCLSNPKNQTPAERIVRMVAANNGRPLTMTEQAEAFRRYRDAVDNAAGRTTESLARAFGFTRTHIEDCLLLVDGCCTALRDALDSGRISPTLAVKLIRRTDGHDEQAELLTAAQRRANQSKEGRTITEKHFDGQLLPKPKTKAGKTDTPRNDTGTTGQAYGYDSSQDGDYANDITPDEDDDDTDDNDPTCPGCGALLSPSDVNPSGLCYRCAPSKEIQPDDSTPPVVGTGGPPVRPDGTGSGAGGRGALPLASSGGGRDLPPPFEPRETLDAQFFIDLLEEARQPNLTVDPRRLTLGYLRNYLEGHLSRKQIIQWVKEGKVD